VVTDVLARFAKAIPAWHELLDLSFLSADAKQKYAAILRERVKRMRL
jgi:hypothetical protein